MKIEVQKLLNCGEVLAASQGRSTFPVNYAIDKNFERIVSAVKPFRNAQQKEPMSWFYWTPPPPPKEDEKAKKGPKSVDMKDKPEAPPPPTKEQIEEGRKAIEEALKTEVEFEPYRVEIGKMCDQLKKLSPAREKLNEDQLDELNENFGVTLKWLDILTEEI
jgi:hypothetical protein